jgi:polyketide biosynthesis enoyl-CoA hydratase PksH
MSYQTIEVRIEQSTCFIKLYRPANHNTISRQMVQECTQALTRCSDSVTIIVIEGLPEIFCLGAEFEDPDALNPESLIDPAELFDLWNQLARGPHISIAHVKGKVNAGGLGFVAACDIVLTDHTAEFSLSEMLFGLFPACVLPFLIRRVGFQKANYLTLTTKTISSQQAVDWGLVDACEQNSETLLRKHLLRLRLLSPAGIHRYKTYMNQLDTILTDSRLNAIAANRLLFSDNETLENIKRYAQTKRFAWEKD